MKLKTLYLSAVAFLLSAMNLPSMAARDYTNLLGQPAAPTATQYTIVIQPNTRYVNVQGGDTVKFIAGDKTFAWSFNGASTIGSFDLNQVAPAGVLDHHVRAYVTPDPKYTGP